MTAKKLSEKFGLRPHEENGSFVEKHYVHNGVDRAASGSIYYYVDSTEKTEFHKIDCDEYWCFIAGSPLEIWMFDESGKLSVANLGIEDNCEPLVFIKKGTVFASKHSLSCSDGTFISCITVPRFTYDGFIMFTQEEMLRKYPLAEKFYKKNC